MKKPKLDIFWNITSEWYFFPLFYLFLVVIFSIPTIIQDPSFGETLWFVALLIPNGIFYFVNLLTGFELKNWQQVFIFPVIYFIILFILISIIQYFKFNRKIILKWLIILILLSIILSFAGCIIGMVTNSNYISAK